MPQDKPRNHLRLTGLAVLTAALLAFPATASLEPAHTDRRLIDGFMKTVFGSENWRVSRAARERISKFTEPVRVHVTNLSGTNRDVDVRTFVGDVNRRIKGLSISVTARPRSANFFVFVVDRANYRSAIREVLPDIRTGFLERSACSGIAFLRHDGAIEQSMAFIVADEGGSFFRHCMIEEILQGLGPSNDHRSLTHSIFNDRNSIADFTAFDDYILNMLYDPRVKAGMDRKTVKQVLPVIVQDVKARRGAS